MSDGECSTKGDRPGEARLRDAVRRARRRIGSRERANLGIGMPCGSANSDDNAPPRRVKLLHLLTTRCSAEDLRTLCFVLGVNHEVLPGTGKAARARELVAYFDRRQDLDRLVEALRSLRQDVGEQLSAISGQRSA